MLIAGKGHETYQVLGEQRIHFDDHEVAREAIKYVAKDKIIPCTNCGMAPMRREIASTKLVALGKGAELARRRFA